MSCVLTFIQCWVGRAICVCLFLTQMTSRAQAQTTNLTDPSMAVPTVGAAVSAARTRASQLFRSMTGVQIPIDDPRLVKMETLIAAGDERSAIKIASMDALFYDVRIRDVARKMSSRAETITAPVSDFVATFVGVVRDSDTTPAKLLLTGNFTYQGDPATTLAVGVPVDDNSLYDSNAHYDFIQAKGFSLMKVLKRVDGQKVYTATNLGTNGKLDNNDDPNAVVTPGALMAHPDPAGLLTTRAFHMAHAIAGTNRRMVEYTFREFMCQAIANFADTGAPDNFVGRDVDRAPSGDHTRFENTCRGCHAQMDAMRPAFSHADFVPDTTNPATAGKAVYNASISPKFARNQTTNNAYNLASLPFATNPGVNAPIGYRVMDSNWVNYMTEPLNMNLFGWRTSNSGTGMGQLGAMIANSEGFSRCLVSRAFSALCRRDPATGDQALLNALASDFEADNYNMRNMYEAVALRPECNGL